MKNQPEKIYLNIGSDNMCFDHDTDNDFNDLIEVTWSEDKIHESDLCYVMEPQWIKINSEADLPKEKGDYWIANENGVFDFIASRDQIKTKFENSTCTHYMRFFKPQPPK